MIIDAVRPSDLTAQDIASWRALQVARGGPWASPYMGPDWALAVERALGPTRRPVKVAVMRQGGEAVGFMAVQAGARTALPVGSAVCDYHGLVAAPGVKIEACALLRALGVQRYDFHHLISEDPVFARGAHGTETSYVVDVSGGWAAYEEDCRARSDILKDTLKKRRKIEREVGEVRFTALSDSRADYDQLLAWKRDQYRRTRQTDVLGTPWVARLLDELFENKNPDFGGALFTLHVGDKLAAAQFHLRGRLPGAPGVLNAWFIAHDAELQRYSPGLVMFGDVVRWLGESPDYAVLDLGPVAYRFKDRLANRTVQISDGFIGRPSSESLVRACAYRVRRAVERLPLGAASEWPGKAMRRIDLWRGLA
jgi:CelD/BcsL family acetyltransferase involved in cellulose biosynthesis